MMWIWWLMTKPFQTVQFFMLCCIWYKICFLQPPAPKFHPNPQSLEVRTWRYGIPSRKQMFFSSYLWNFLSLESRPYLFRIMTTEKYKSETAAARMLMTIIWRKLVFRIRGHPTGEMLKCQDAGKRQEMPILKFQKTGLAKAVCSREASPHLHWSES